MGKINENTVVEITLAKFLALLGGFFTIIFGFYMLVIEPKINEQSNQIKEFNIKVDDGFKDINLQLMEMNNGIGVINGNIAGINNRFHDLNTARQNNSNTGGSFGDNN